MVIVIRCACSAKRCFRNQANDIPSVRGSLQDLVCHFQWTSPFRKSAAFGARRPDGRVPKTRVASLRSRNDPYATSE